MVFIPVLVLMVLRVIIIKSLYCNQEKLNYISFLDCIKEYKDHQDIQKVFKLWDNILLHQAQNNKKQVENIVLAIVADITSVCCNRMWTVERLLILIEC